MKKKKSNKLNLIICGIAFVIMIVYACSVDGIDNLINSLGNMNIGFLLIGFMFMCLYWLLEALGVHAAVKAIHPEQKFWHTLVVSMLGQYYNCITPSSSGGQPMQAYYFTRFGTPLPHAMTGLVSKFIVYQFVLTVYSAVILLCSFNSFAADFAPLMALVLLGFIINTIVIILLLMLAFFKAPVKKAAVWGIKLLGKIRIFKTRKDVDEKLAMVEKIIDDYHDNFCFIKSKPLLLLKMVFYTFIQLTVYFSITYVIYLGFGLSGTSYFTIISCQAFVLMISAFMPLPGAMGAAEGSYFMFFKDIFTKSLVNASTIIWRFLTFYAPIILGLVLSLCLGRIMKNVDVKPVDGEVELTPEDIKGDLIE